jgi:ABC-type transporter Mla subunit MlaD
VEQKCLPDLPQLLDYIQDKRASLETLIQLLEQLCGSWGRRLEAIGAVFSSVTRLS